MEGETVLTQYIIQFWKLDYVNASKYDMQGYYIYLYNININPDYMSLLLEIEHDILNTFYMYDIIALLLDSYSEYLGHKESKIGNLNSKRHSQQF